MVQGSVHAPNPLRYWYAFVALGSGMLACGWEADSGLEIESSQNRDTPLLSADVEMSHTIGTRAGGTIYDFGPNLPDPKAVKVTAVRVWDNIDSPIVGIAFEYSNGQVLTFGSPHGIMSEMRMREGEYVQELCASSNRRVAPQLNETSGFLDNIRFVTNLGGTLAGGYYDLRGGCLWTRSGDQAPVATNTPSYGNIDVSASSGPWQLINRGQIFGLYGRTHWGRIGQIGAYFAPWVVEDDGRRVPEHVRDVIRGGETVGGWRGSLFDQLDTILKRRRTDLYEVTLYGEQYLEGIETIYAEDYATILAGRKDRRRWNKFGQREKFLSQSLRLAPGEYINRVDACTGNKGFDNRIVVVGYLALSTNYGKSIAVGDSYPYTIPDNRFAHGYMTIWGPCKTMTAPSEDHQFAGFYGRCAGEGIEQLGVYWDVHPRADGVDYNFPAKRGCFARQPRQQRVWMGPWANHLGAGDFDGDGDDDIANVFGHEGHSFIDLYLGGQERFELERWGWWQGSHFDGQQWLLGDFDGDFHDDVAKAYEAFTRPTFVVHAADEREFEATSWHVLQDVFPAAGPDSRGKFKGSYFSGQFTGQRQHDLANVFTHNGRVSIDMYKTHNGAFSRHRFITNAGAYPEEQQWLVGNIDNDFTDELIVVFNDEGKVSIDVYEADAGLFQPVTRFVHRRMATQQGDFFGRQKWLIGNFAGDKSDDLAVVYPNWADGEQMMIDLYVSTGERFVHMHVPTEMRSIGQMTEQTQLLAGDFDAGGYDEIVRVDRVDDKHVSINQLKRVPCWLDHNNIENGGTAQPRNPHNMVRGGEPIGGTEMGEWFDHWSLAANRPHAGLHEVRFFGESGLEGLQVSYSADQPGPIYGGASTIVNNGHVFDWDFQEVLKNSVALKLSPGEYITQVRACLGERRETFIRVGPYVSHLGLKTNYGRGLSRGWPIGACKIYNAPSDDHQLVGFFGREDYKIVQIGVTWGLRP